MSIFLPDLNWMAERMFSGRHDAASASLSHGLEFDPPDSIARSPLWPMLAWTTDGGTFSPWYIKTDRVPRGLRTHASLVPCLEVFEPSTAPSPLLIPLDETGLPADPDGVIPDDNQLVNVLGLTYAETYALKLLNKIKSGTPVQDLVAAIDSTAATTPRFKRIMASIAAESGSVPGQSTPVPEAGDPLFDLLHSRNLLYTALESIRLCAMLEDEVPPNVTVGSPAAFTGVAGQDGSLQCPGPARRHGSEVSVYRKFEKFDPAMVSVADTTGSGPRIVVQGAVPGEALKVLWTSKKEL